MTSNLTNLFEIELRKNLCSKHQEINRKGKNSLQASRHSSREETHGADLMSLLGASVNAPNLIKQLCVKRVQSVSTPSHFSPPNPRSKWKCAILGKVAPIMQSIVDAKGCIVPNLGSIEKRYYSNGKKSSNWDGKRARSTKADSEN